jgi:hypothetical protein
MIEKGFQILVGDANGADKAIQRYLAEKSYPNVFAPTKQFRTIKTADDLRDLLAQGDSNTVERIVSELLLNSVLGRAGG